MLTSYMPIGNEDFFACINSEDKAYFLGFMLADGNIDDSCNQLRSRLELAAKDRHILYEFRKRIQSDNKITCKPKPGKAQDSYSLRLNKKTTEDLMRLGLTPRKSLNGNLNWTKIPIWALPHVVRGLFDGDGSFVNRTRNNAFEINIALSKQTGESLLKILKKHLGIVASLRPEKTIFRMSMNNHYDMNLFCKWIYNCDPKLRLKRKYNVYLKFKRDKSECMEKREELVTFKQAKKLVFGLASTKSEWIELCKNKKKPIGVPANPRLVYMKSGDWKGFRDFLGK